MLTGYDPLLLCHRYVDLLSHNRRCQSRDPWQGIQRNQFWERAGCFRSQKLGARPMHGRSRCSRLPSSAGLMAWTCLRTRLFPYANLRDSMELEVLSRTKSLSEVDHKWGKQYVSYISRCGSNILCCVRFRKVYVCPVAGRLRWGAGRARERDKTRRDSDIHVCTYTPHLRHTGFRQEWEGA